jgi:cytosine/uracil/thiamine/allantoin permease
MSGSYINQASTFTTVLSGWAVFLSKIEILMSDYFLVRRCGLHVSDMHMNSRASAY